MQDQTHDDTRDGSPDQHRPVTGRPDGPPPSDGDTDFDIAISDFLPEGVDLADGEAPEPDDRGPMAEIAAPAVEPEPEVDLELLGRLEDDLADVDAALAAIDSGDIGASPLLQRLLGEQADQPPAPGTSPG